MSFDSKDIAVKITCIKVSKPFIKIFAMKKQSVNSLCLRENLPKLFSKADPQKVKLGDTCIARIGSNEYERCRVLHIWHIESFATINCIDTGFNADLSLDHLRILLDPEIIAIPQLYREFIISGVKLKDNATSNQEIRKCLRSLHIFLSKNFFILTPTSDELGFVNLMTEKDNKDLVNDIIFKEFNFSSVLERISPFEQEKMLKHITGLSIAPHIHASLNISSISDKRNAREVQIVNYDQGIKGFYLRYTQDEFHTIQSLINGYDSYQQLRLYPTPPIGSKCIVQHSNFKFRASIEHVDPELNKIRVLLIDIGHRLEVKKHQVFYLPGTQSGVPALAKRYQLAGFRDSADLSIWENDNREDEYSFVFQSITKGKSLILEHYEGNNFANTTRIPMCHLYDGKVDVTTAILNYNPHGKRIPDQEPLALHSQHDVEIVHTSSPTLFHVQLRNKQNKDTLEELEKKLKILNSPNFVNPIINDIVVVEIFHRLMRCRVREHVTGKVFSVFAIDYGVIEDVYVTDMKMISEELLSYPPMAYLCCLEQYKQSMNKSTIPQSTIDDFFKICDKEKLCSMIVDGKNDKDPYLVDLFDSQHQSIGQCLRTLQDSAAKNACQSSHWSNASGVNSHFRKRVSGDIEIYVDDYFESPEKDLVEKTLVGEGIHNSTVVGTIGHQRPDRDSARRNIFTLADSESSLNSSSSGIASISSNGKGYELVKITEMTNPLKFTIQKISLINEFEKFQRKVTQEAEKADEFRNYTIGDDCLAYLELKTQWHRATIIDVDDDETGSFIAVVSKDDGTNFCIIDSKDLREISVTLSIREPFAISCALPIFYNAKQEALTSSYLRPFQLKENLSYEPIVQHNSVTFIELYENGKNIVDILVESNVCKRTHVVPSGLAVVTQFESIRSFIVTMKDNHDKLNTINIASNHSEITNHPADMKVNKIVWAKSKDNKWHRARIVKTDREKLQVYFIDLGIEETVHDVYEIRDCSILSIPPLAIKCSLAYIPETANERNANSKMSNFLKDLKHIVEIEMIEPGVDCAKVDFKVNGTNVSEVLFCSNMCETESNEWQ